MNIKLVLMVIAATALTTPVCADNHGNVMPPPGPYRSMADVNQHGQMQNLQNESMAEQKQMYLSNQSGRVVPDWVRQRQAQMQNRMNQLNMPQAQNWNRQQPQQWQYDQRPAMPNAYSGRLPVFQNNRMQQPFPSAHGPVYGPGIPPADYYRRPVQPMPGY